MAKRYQCSLERAHSSPGKATRLVGYINADKM